MLLRIDPNSGVPAYRQLIDQVKLQIAFGRLREGEELPSTRALSAEIGLNPMTISKAYSLLERDGVLQRQRGRPLTVAESNGAIQSQTARQALRDSLFDAASLAQRLGIGQAEAVSIFQDVLNQKPQ